MHSVSSRWMTWSTISRPTPPRSSITCSGIPLGTVIGLINAFAAVAQSNPAEKASLLAASISVAMNNTALGLVVAITLLLAHMYLETRTTELTDSLEVATVKVMNALYESQQAQQQAGGAPTGGRA